ncbi:MAG: FGGY-family carbohydrate kinase [Anaerolineae bacterium]|nr:FGGY-family carbohydrate kinase [Anaerolineae bacterium]
MATSPLVLGIDQGTSGTRAVVMNADGAVLGYAYRPLARIYPQPGWVEQDPWAVVSGVAEVVGEAVALAGCRSADIAACGIACQRNTDFVWDAVTGRPLANAITWQDLRTLPLVAELDGWERAAERRYRLGYYPGPYSSALHLAWRMANEPAVAAAAQAGTLRIGLSAAWLLTALGRPAGHCMDYSLVQALGLYDFRSRRYWPEWLDRLGVPADALPSAQPTLHPFGTLRVVDRLGQAADVPVLATIGDQQAALFGYGCHRPGEAECTHGTATFVDVFVGDQPPEQALINVYFAWDLGHGPTYCLEADATVTGAAVRWMRESLRLFDHDQELDQLAASVADAGGVVFVPAFTGLNVPYNDHSARGTILGLTLGSTRGHIARAFLEALGFQVRAILETIQAETGLHIDHLYLGGGLSASDMACQIQADLLGIPTVRPAVTETTARGAALLAGLGAGLWRGLEDLPPLPGPLKVFEPRLSPEARDAAYARWQRAVERARRWD